MLTRLVDWALDSRWLVMSALVALVILVVIWRFLLGIPSVLGGGVGIGTWFLRWLTSKNGHLELYLHPVKSRDPRFDGRFCSRRDPGSQLASVS